MPPISPDQLKNQTLDTLQSQAELRMQATQPPTTKAKPPITPGTITKRVVSVLLSWSRKKEAPPLRLYARAPRRFDPTMANVRLSSIARHCDELVNHHDIFMLSHSPKFNTSAKLT
eukprot:TRINITY_DN65333_c0_g1_i3.p2 TRINITY_DN65333_c0_g1~~TRINITY_DN65333_c0_g1_i3.p2  ORF type:complete len:116 (+),score=4.76 TRINITY_DN65333_c0_g1_i3:850-1197(+)